jgi:hypothetical protein
VDRQIVENDTDTLGLGKVNVSKFAHVGSKIDCGPALGDFYLAPRPMDVDEHEQIGCSITSIFAIVPLELARLGRDRRANLGRRRSMPASEFWRNLYSSSMMWGSLLTTVGARHYAQIPKCGALHPQCVNSTTRLSRAH